MTERRRITVEGIVQGVGFRPFVYRLAREHDLAGQVRNETAGVKIDVEGDAEALDRFQAELGTEAPPLSRIEALRVQPLDPAGATGFRIVRSRASDEREAFVPPDTATCADCLAEMRDPTDRRYRYPFLNCTNCGPRLTIIRDLPYDRPRTTMAGFEMCPSCREEYEDPGDRRYHAQPTACPECGPRLELRDAAREEADEGRTGDETLLSAARALRNGLVVAVKGLGGYHLACDATAGGAVARLRHRKHREAKPLAVMARDLASARELCRIGPEEEDLLTSHRRPIVLLAKREGASPVAEEVAPDNRHLGVMLPYTPLHHLLMEEVGRPLVMTSGNTTDEPVAYRDDDALARLSNIADRFLLHDRPIETRCDDSVTRVLCGGEVPVRRSRGYAPEPVDLPGALTGPEAPRSVLAVGGHLKNTFCLTRGRHAFPSHHIGDLENLRAFEALREGIRHYLRLFDLRPEVVAHDLHPDYLSTGLAERLADELGARLEPVQHHHAHAAACAAEHDVTDPVIGVSFDGTGYGTDGAIWGGEVLVADLHGFRRAAHLGYVPLTGGEAAIRQPWRTALSHLRSTFGPDLGRDIHDVTTSLEEAAGSKQWDGVQQMLDADVGAPLTSSVGRLFDAVSALLGIRHEISFEAQAAMELEMAADPAVEDDYPVELVPGGGKGGSGHDDESVMIWNPGPLFRGILDDLAAGTSRPVVAGRFHSTVAAAAVRMCERVRRQEDGLDRVTLSGGVFQNALLVRKTVGRLEEAGFQVLLHRTVPPTDGGLSYGQAAVALARRSETVAARPS